jgi:hypothetical protein
LSFGEQAYPGRESASSNLRPYIFSLYFSITSSGARPFEELRLPPKMLPVKQENHDLHNKMDVTVKREECAELHDYRNHVLRASVKTMCSTARQCPRKIPFLGIDSSKTSLIP